MKYFVMGILPALALAFATLATPAIAAETKEASVSSKIGFETLRGQWVRPDGGYTITIEDVAPDGKLDAVYANPGSLPFSQARASMDGDTLKVFLELRAGGYNGSTYTLTYDPANDVLRGVYYQAVAKQKFDVFFERVK